MEEAARRLATATVSALDLSTHAGAHPRIGVLDVVPFVAFEPAPARLPRRPTDEAVAARDRFSRWLADTLGVPAFLYGPLPDGSTRTLPALRRHAWNPWMPDAGPAAPHPSAGAAAVGARAPMVAYNLWVADADKEQVRAVAACIRGPAVRALGFELDAGLQVSCNLIDPMAVGPADVYTQVAQLLAAGGATVARCELVGLVPAAVLAAIPQQRWAELGLSPDVTVEARLSRRRPDGVATSSL